MSSQAIAFQELVAPAAWHTVDIISDLHLQADRPATVEAWRGYMQTTPADALFILGDLFEVWVGDDAAALPGFEAQCAVMLHEAAARRPIYFMHGNRDFLLGQDFAARAGITLLADPAVLVFMNERWLLSHGDALCLEDTEYLRFREQVRSPAWQQAVLAQPLEQRRALARSVRSQSEARQREPDMVWADVDGPAAREWLAKAGAHTLIHGHTHRPAVHDLGGGAQRIVLSDWDLDAHPPRAQVLCLSATGAKRVDLR
jgi:UDP-2,3-diacylglucosamine hydrolase